MNKSSILNAALLLALGASFVVAAGRNNVYVNPSSRNEGDTRSGIGITCNHDAWILVLITSSKRRSAILQVQSSESTNVCLSETNTIGTACDTSLSGIVIEPGGSYTDYSEDELYCRSAASTSSKLQGMTFSDSEDTTDD